MAYYVSWLNLTNVFLSFNPGTSPEVQWVWEEESRWPDSKETQERYAVTQWLYAMCCTLIQVVILLLITEITILIVSVQTNAPSLSSYYTKDFNVEIVRYVDDKLRVFLSTLTERVVCFNGFLP